MIRIWAKVVKDEKILKDIIFEQFKPFNTENFFKYIASICEQLDIATPIILSKHIYHYLTFNCAVFFPQDFPEDVDFDSFVIEEASNY